VNGQLIELAPVQRARTAALRLVAFARQAEQPDGPDGRRLTSRQLAADVALAVALSVASLVVIAGQTAVVTRGFPAGPPSPPISIGTVLYGVGWKHGALPAVAARAAPLAIRRLHPLTAFWLCLAACFLLTWLPGIALASFLAPVPAAYSAVAYSRYRRAVLLSIPAAALVLAFSSDSPVLPAGYLLLTAVLVLIPTVAVGEAMRSWRRQADESRTRLSQLQAEHEDATRQAIGLERSRIARELHDVVTHNVSMMVVQAGGARRVLAAAPEDARSALLAIEESGRAAIVELQHLLGLLAPGENDDAGGAPLPPQPGLDRLPSLIGRVAAAGLPVELVTGGTTRALPPGIDLAAYRVVQEALTNVVKHAGRPRTIVTIDYRDDGLVVEIADDGAAADPGQPAGRGLLGLRERLALYGGELTAAPRPGGGWRVLARIPVPAGLAAQPVPS
jgi:signal transduction histidine kinase